MTPTSPPTSGVPRPLGYLDLWGTSTSGGSLTSGVACFWDCPTGYPDLWGSLTSGVAWGYPDLWGGLTSGVACFRGALLLGLSHEMKAFHFLWGCPEPVVVRQPHGTDFFLSRGAVKILFQSNSLTRWMFFLSRGVVLTLCQVKAAPRSGSFFFLGGLY